ncbi:MAG: hypothetical protein WAJ85_09760 [Candidatus Baltobacteraceae bacterium]
MTKLADLRLGHAPLPPSAGGNDPAGDIAAVAPPGIPSPATEPVEGTMLLGSLGGAQRYVLKIPAAWNGKLAVCGTPATRSEYVNDGLFGDFLLARGYAYAASNKGIPYNAVLESAAATPDRTLAYPVPFDVMDLRKLGMVCRFGALWPEPVPIASWQTDLAALVREAKARVEEVTGEPPSRTYALGVSVGGGQVRWLLENEPDLVDGGLEWAAVYWHPERNVLTCLPAFLRHMPDWVRSGFEDRDAHDAIVAAGFPPDRLQDHPQFRSLWNDHYANIPPFYADATVFAYALMLDPQARSSFELPPAIPNPLVDGPGFVSNASGLALPENRASYVLSDEGKKTIAGFAHTGRIGKPLVGIAGSADVFITPQCNFAGYLEAVRAAGRADRYWQYLVEGGTHVDRFVALGYGLQAQLPFAWAAFDRLVAIVEDGERPPGAGTVRAVSAPAELR